MAIDKVVMQMRHYKGCSYVLSIIYDDIQQAAGAFIFVLDKFLE